MKKCLLMGLVVLSVAIAGCSESTTPPEGKKTEDVAVAQATAGKSYLPGDKFSTGDGMAYEIINVGHGRQAANGDRVYVHYVGTFEDGNQFDSSRDRGVPIDFILGQGEVIQGWDVGVAMMRVGDRRKFTIPGNLAYGPRGRPGIPPNATLYFDVELMRVAR